jgi:hypothetical protein
MGAISNRRSRCTRRFAGSRWHSPGLGSASRRSNKGFGAASEVGDSNSLALLAGRLHENFRDCGRLTGELQHGPLSNIQNNVLVNPDYSRAIARIVSAVAPYPEAREAIIAALRELDAANTSTPALADLRSEGAPSDG